MGRFLQLRNLPLTSSIPAADKIWKQRIFPILSEPRSPSLPMTVAHQDSLSMGFSWQEVEWVAMPSSRVSSQPRDRTQVSSCIDQQVLHHWATGGNLEGTRSPAPSHLLPHSPAPPAGATAWGGCWVLGRLLHPHCPFLTFPSKGEILHLITQS